MRAPTPGRPAGPEGRGEGTGPRAGGAGSPLRARGPRTAEPGDPRAPSPGGGGRGLIDSSDVSAGRGGGPGGGGGGRRRELRPQSAASEIKGPLQNRDVSGPEGAAGSGTLTQLPQVGVPADPGSSDPSLQRTSGRRRQRMRQRS